MPKSKTPKLAIAYRFTQTKVTDLLSQGHTVWTDMNLAVDRFTTPPLPMAMLKQDLDNLAASCSAANDGAKKDMAQRNKDRQILEHDLMLLGAYVLKVANGDPTTVTASGFVLAPPRVHKPARPLAQPTVASIDQGVSGQLLAWVTSVQKAYTYDVRCSALVNGLPGNWTISSVTSTKVAVAFNDLAPGTIYAFQARAMGRTGYTNWSDSATRMCI